MQSVGLGALWIAFALVMWILILLLGYIPFIGTALETVLFVITLLGTLVVVITRIRMMLNAYRGLAYVMPFIGETLRRFE